jgi:hypothetical protein
MNLWYYTEIIQAAGNFARGIQAAIFIGNKKVCVCPLLARICPKSSSSEILLKEMPSEGSKSQVCGQEEVAATQP